MLFDVIKFWR